MSEVGPAARRERKGSLDDDVVVRRGAWRASQGISPVSDMYEKPGEGIDGAARGARHVSGKEQERAPPEPSHVLWHRHYSVDHVKADAPPYNRIPKRIPVDYNVCITCGRPRRRPCPLGECPGAGPSTDCKGHDWADPSGACVVGFQASILVSGPP